MFLNGWNMAFWKFVILEKMSGSKFSNSHKKITVIPNFMGSHWWEAGFYQKTQKMMKLLCCHVFHTQSMNIIVYFSSTSSVKTVGLPCCSFEINANLCTVVRFQWKSMKNVALSLFSLHKRWNSLYSRVVCIKDRWKPLYCQAFS